MKKFGWIAIVFVCLKAGAQKKIIVAADGSGDFKTIQSALDAVPSNSDAGTTLFIKKGVYKEIIVVDATK